MFIDQYFTETDGRIRFTREQGSRSAMVAAGDFNQLTPSAFVFAATCCSLWCWRATV